MKVPHPGRLRRIPRWIGDHTYASLWVVLAPVSGVALAINTGADWLATTLFGLAGLSWSGVLLPRAVRHAAVPFAGTVAALSGGMLVLIFGDAASHDNPKSAPETGILLLALLASGAAALVGQLLNQVDQRRFEKQLVDRLDVLFERQTSELNELRADIARLVADRTDRRQRWWSRQ